MEPDMMLSWTALAMIEKSNPSTPFTAKAHAPNHYQNDRGLGL